jgi:hypothetical protein
VRRLGHARGPAPRTADVTHHLAAIAALHSLNQAYPHLTDLAEAEAYTLPTPRRQHLRHRDDRAIAAEAAQLRQERADRIHSQRHNLRQVHAPAPIRAALIDAQIRAHITLEAVCWDVAELLRVQPPPYVDARAAHIRYSQWDTRVAYLTNALRLVAPAAAERAARQLQRADTAVRDALGIGPDRRLLPGDPPCPACGRQTLRAEVSSLDERDWTITCAPDCHCVGAQCTCKRPERAPDNPHLWPVEEYANNFGELRGYLRAMRAVEAGAITRDGIVYATADQLATVLDGGVTGKILSDWKRRGLINSIKVGRHAWYQLDQAYAINERARDRTKAR